MNRLRTNIVITLLFGVLISCSNNDSKTTEKAVTENGKEYHVAKTGDDKNEGSSSSPLLTIQAAAELALPGDVITVQPVEAVEKCALIMTNNSINRLPVIEDGILVGIVTRGDNLKALANCCLSHE